ncbi:MAG TPA: hypothetical protein VL984_01400 [Acidimicrobiales bacterium]|nr:hypothetical protein [Acidimicrobiales bacterium]
MAEIRVEDGDVVVKLAALESLASLRKQLRIPLTSLRMVQVDESPMAGRCLWRAPGLSWPGTFAIGACRRGGRREFAAVRAHVPAVVLDVEGTTWDRVVISDRDASSKAADLAGMLLGRGPGRPGHKPGQKHPYPAPLD